MELILIRHGETEGNRLRQYVGCKTDQPLTPEARTLALSMRERYPRVERVFTTPLLRTRETASILFPGQTAECIEGLRESNFGDFEGKTYDELKNDPIYQQYISGDLTVKCPGEGGESRREFACRCCLTMMNLAERLYREQVSSAALVIHGGTIMALMSEFAEPVRPFYEWMLSNLSGYRVAVTREPLRFHLLETYRSVGPDCPPILPDQAPAGKKEP